MDFDVREEFNLSKDIRNVERKFYTFYLKIIKDYFDLNENFLLTAKVIPNHEKQTHNKNNFHIFNDPGELLLCIQHTCFAIQKFYSLLGEYVEFAKYLSKKRIITMYCVSGESLFSAFGLCAVIDKAVEQYDFSHNSSSKKIEVIVIDKRENWRSLCSFIIESVNSCYKNVEIEFEFINERSSRLKYEVFDIRKEVDIVVMTRYLSKFPYMRVRAHFLQVILNRMKELSILFYVDENHEIYYNTLKHLISETDTLVEIMNKETVYEILDDFENTEYYSEFRFLRNTVFKPVMFSTCIKCCGIKDKTSVNKNIKDYDSSLSESRRRIKQKILERLKKENSPIPHLSTSEEKYLRMSSTAFLNVSVQTTSPKTSVTGIIEKLSKKATETNICPLGLQISDKNETKLLECSTDRQFLFPSVATLQSRQKNTANAQMYTANTAFEKLQNTYKYLEEIRELNDKIIKTSKAVDKFVSKNSRNKHKCLGKGKKPNAENVETNKAIDKLALTNSQNKDKYPGKGKKSKRRRVKSRKLPAQRVAINPDNKDKQSKVNKQNVETVKSVKGVEKSATADLKVKNKHSGINKANAATIKRKKVIGILVTLNLRSKYSYSEEETFSSNADDLETDKRAKKLALTKLKNKNGYKSPHLMTEESLSTYVNHLSDIYYSKYFDKGKPCALKLK